MASRIVHLAIASEITKIHPLPEPERFFLGSILPDACPDRQAHYNRLLANGTKKTNDLSGFRRRFGSQLRRDPLYLGYYLHLLQDILFRNEIYDVVGFDPRPAGNIQQLHLDYRLTNRYVINKFGLTNQVRVPAGLEAEPLWKEWQFALTPFLEELAQDFHDTPQGTPKYFTETVADRLIDRSVRLCLQELEAMKCGDGHFEEDRYAWKKWQLPMRGIIRFRQIDRPEFDCLAPQMFAILSRNMLALHPEETLSNDDYPAWFAYQSEHFGEKTFLLAEDDTHVVGYLQFSIHASQLTIEEIEIAPEYQVHFGILRGLLQKLAAQIPPQAETAAAYIHKDNLRSARIAEKLGLSPAGETPSGKSRLYAGSIRTILENAGAFFRLR